MDGFVLGFDGMAVWVVYMYIASVACVCAVVDWKKHGLIMVDERPDSEAAAAHPPATYGF
jgi:hypothetical protein